MRNLMTTGLGLAALLAAGSAFAGDITTSADEVGVSSNGQLIEAPTLGQRLVDATNDAATGHEDDHDDHDHGEHADDSGDTGGDDKGCGCASTTLNGAGALAVFLPLGLVGLRRRQG